MEYLPLIFWAILPLAWLLEMVTLAGDDWQVSRSTPVSNFCYNQLTDVHSFCKLFWLSLGWSVIGVPILAVSTLFVLTNALAIPVFFLLGYDVVGKEIFVMGYLFWALVGFVSLIALIAFGMDAISEYAISKQHWEEDKPKNKVVEGISKWYAQVKEKYCPVISNKR